MFIPPDYEDLVEYDVSSKMRTPGSFQFWLILYIDPLVLLWLYQDSGTSLYGERAKEKPFAARFASPDRHVSIA